MRAALQLPLSAFVVLVASAAVHVACDDSGPDAREDEIAAVLADADEPVIRARPALAAGKYALMASAPLDFMRGSLPLYRHDAREGTALLSVSRFALEVPLVPSIGDPHFENFGVLRASDATLGLEPNDFDGADDAPYLFDVRRLASSMALAALTANADDPAARTQTAGQARAIARATVVGYRTAIEHAAAGMPPERVTPTSPGADNAIVADVFRRSDRDEAARAELGTLTTLTGTTRRLIRGVIDPTDPQNLFADLPPAAYAALPEAIDAWRRTLVTPIPAEQLVLLDAVRELGSGVSSWPRVRVVILVRGPSDDPADDRILELKELADSGIAGLYPPGVHHDDVRLRVLETSRSAWWRPDAEPRWGVTTWLGLPAQIRAETEGQKNVRLSRMVGGRGTPAALTGLGTILGGIIGRVHSSGMDGARNAQAVYGRIVIDPEGFADEQADVAVAYAQQIVDDTVRFHRALDRRGFALGVPVEPADAPRPDFAAVLGTPPPPAPLPALP